MAFLHFCSRSARCRPPAFLWQPGGYSTYRDACRLAQTGEGIKECELVQWFVQEVRLLAVRPMTPRRASVGAWQPQHLPGCRTVVLRCRRIDTASHCACPSLVARCFPVQGDEVEEFGRVCEVQSDKATIEISSPYAGGCTRRQRCQLAVTMRLYKQQIMVGHGACRCVLSTQACLPLSACCAVLCCCCRADGCTCPCPARRCGEEAAPQARRRGAGERGQQGCIEQCLGCRVLTECAALDSARCRCRAAAA